MGKSYPIFPTQSHIIEPRKGFTLNHKTHKIRVGLGNGVKAGKILQKNVPGLEKSSSRDAQGTLTRTAPGVGTLSRVVTGVCHHKKVL